MARIEWTRYSGEEIEHAIAMFIISEDAWVEKITPSCGDGGVDLLSRHPKTTVYQVKRFTSPLSSGQKKKVIDSLEKLVTDERWQHLDVDEWRLVTPWDPTPEAENWLQEEARQRAWIQGRFGNQTLGKNRSIQHRQHRSVPNRFYQGLGCCI